MRIVLGSDEDTPLVSALFDHLAGGGHSVDRLVVGRPWPEVGHRVGEAVVTGAADMGVVCCWTGTGVTMAANKVRGVRAALCADAVTAAGARRWNDANVVGLSLRATTEAVAMEIVDAFLSGRPDPGEADLLATLE